MSEYQKRLLVFLQRWPKDLLRKNLQFQELAHAQKPPASVEAMERNLVALDRLSRNKYAEEYKLSDRTMKPQSRPTYYDDICNRIKPRPKGLIPLLKDFGNFLLYRG